MAGANTVVRGFPVLRRKKTPYLAISKAALCRKVGELKSFASRVKVFYALKANSHPEISQLFHELGLGFEVSSQKELDTLVHQGVGTDAIISSNPVKEAAFIRKAHGLGITCFVLDSRAEAEKIAAVAPGSSILVRLAVDNEGAAWPLDRKFGVESEQAFDLLLYARGQGLHPVGITFHVGSQCTQTSSWDRALLKAGGLWRRSAASGLSLRVLNLGGGFPASYGSEVASVSTILSQVLTAVGQLFPPDTAVWVEPGRVLVAEAGVLVSSVIGKAARGGEDWLYVDVGVFNGLAEVLGGITYPMTAEGDGPRKSWVVAGPSCDSLDVVARGVELAEPGVGQKLFIRCAGAYTTGYASTFNGARKPRVYLVEEEREWPISDSSKKTLSLQFSTSTL